MTDRQVKNLIERIYLSQHDQEKREALKIVYQAFLDSTIHPTRKNGKWVDHIGVDLGIENQWFRDDGKSVFVQCDQCKSLYVRNFMNNWHYCPSCGARMEGSGDEML